MNDLQGTSRMSEVVIEALARRQDVLPTVHEWFEREWPDYYGPGGRASARCDLLAYSRLSALPMGIVAFRDGKACGFAALKSEPFPSHPHLGPWVGAAFVLPALRRQGIGRLLLLALEPEARALGHTRIHCATASSASLLQRCGWSLLAQVSHEGQAVGVFEKAL